MSAFREALSKSPEYKELEKAVKNGKTPLGALGLTAIHKAHLISSLCADSSRKALVVMPDESSATKFCEDLKVFGLNALVYPERDFSFNGAQYRSHEYEQRRLKVLSNMLEGNLDVAVCSVEAAMQRTIPCEDLKKHSLTLKVGKDTSLDRVLEVLSASGYTRSDMVEGVGQFSVRGGILDLFSPDAETPVRIDFWGDTVESMSHFDIDSQRRTDKVEEFSIMPSTEILFSGNDELKEKIEAFIKNVKGKGSKKAKESLLSDIEKLESGENLACEDKYLALAYEKFSTIFDYADENFLTVICDSSNVKERATNCTKLMNEEIKALFEEGVLCNGLDKYYLTLPELFKEYEKHKIVYFDNFARGSFDIPVKDLISFTTTQLPVWNGKLDVLLDDISPLLEKSATVVVH